MKNLDSLDVNDTRISSFLHQLWSKIPRVAPKVNTEKLLAKERERAAAELLERNRQYKLVEDDDGPSTGKAATKKPKTEPDSSESDSDDKERASDLKERDEFAERLKQKDKEKRRNVVAAGKGFAEAAARLKMEASDRESIVPKLRIQSRRTYLEKRKEDKLVELAADVYDEENLFQV